MKMFSFDKKYFEKVFSNRDPWNYTATEYETTKYGRQLRAIKKYCPKPRAILEVGCAEGVFTAMLAGSFPKARITGVDISRTAIERAREKYNHLPNVTFIEADAVQLFRQGLLGQKRFDVITQSESLHYIFVRSVFRFGSYINQLTGHLDKGGIFVTSNGLNIQTRFMLGIGYRILGRTCKPIRAAKYREWNEFRKKHLAYDLRVFRSKQ